MTDLNYFGQHFLLDCGECDYESITDKEKILEFCDFLIKEIDMIPVGDPQIEYCLEGDLNEGYSLLQLIVTSNITAHFVTKSKTAYIDIFSCKEFSTETVKNVVKSYFDPQSIRETFLIRNA